MHLKHQLNSPVPNKNLHMPSLKLFIYVIIHLVICSSEARVFVSLSANFTSETGVFLSASANFTQAVVPSMILMECQNASETLVEFTHAQPKFTYAHSKVILLFIYLLIHLVMYSSETRVFFSVSANFTQTVVPSIILMES